MITVYGIKNCDSVKKAINWLKKNNINYSFFDYKTQEITPKKLKKFIKFIGKSNIINKRSLTWKKLPNNIKNHIVSCETTDSDIIVILSRYPLLMKRPIIENKNLFLVGFHDQDYKLNIK